MTESGPALSPDGKHRWHAGRWIATQPVDPTTVMPAGDTTKHHRPLRFTVAGIAAGAVVGLGGSLVFGGDGGRSSASLDESRPVAAVGGSDIHSLIDSCERIEDVVDREGDGFTTVTVGKHVEIGRPVPELVIPATDMAHRIGRASRALHEAAAGLPTDSPVAQAVAAMEEQYALIREGLLMNAAEFDALEAEGAFANAKAANSRILDARTGIFRACDAALDIPAS